MPPVPLRVVHVQKATGIGGSEHHLLTLLTRFDREEVTPHLLVLEDSAHPARTFLAKIVRVGLSHEVVPISGHLDPLLPLRLVRTFRRWRPDVVHTHLLHADLYAIPAARLAGVGAVVSTKHGGDPFRRGVVGRADAAIARLADRVIVISDHLKGFYSDVEGIPAGKLIRIYYGLDDHGPPVDPTAVRREFAIDEGIPLAGAVARLEEAKGHRHLLAAFARLRTELPAARLLLAGSGLQERALRAQSAALGLDEAVIFAGFRDDVDRVMASLDLVVVPSLWEGFGLVLLEAMRAGRAVVATAVSAIPEVLVDGVTGLLVSPGDEAALAAAMASLLRDPPRRAAMGAAGRARLHAAFSVEAMVRSTVEVYREVAAPRGGRS
ncbi:MAG TPA: glycosyltransferase [bacterium]|nr:glycosyltransferase [bacterium]